MGTKFDNIEGRGREAQADAAPKNPEARAGKIDKNQKLALQLGNLTMWSIEAGREKKGPNKKKEQPVALDVTIGDIRQQQECLAGDRRELEKRDADFKNREKAMLGKLGPFIENPEKLDSARAVLVRELSIGPNAKQKEYEPLGKEGEEVREKTLKALDECLGMTPQTDLGERRKEYLAAYAVMSQQQILNTETQMHGLRDTQIVQASDVEARTQEVGKLFAGHSAAAQKLGEILDRRDLDEEEKSRFVSAALSVLDDPDSLKTLAVHRDSINAFASSGREYRERDLELSRLRSESRRAEEERSSFREQASAEELVEQIRSEEQVEKEKLREA